MVAGQWWGPEGSNDSRGGSCTVLVRLGTQSRAWVAGGVGTWWGFCLFQAETQGEDMGWWGSGSHHPRGRVAPGTHVVGRKTVLEISRGLEPVSSWGSTVRLVGTETCAISWMCGELQGAKSCQGGFGAEENLLSSAGNHQIQSQKFSWNSPVKGKMMWIPEWIGAEGIQGKENSAASKLGCTGVEETVSVLCV